jgi:hypothetical protein
MERWARLTPEQRKQARENYRKLSKVPAQKRGNLSEQWAEYQALTPEERKRLVPPPDAKPKPRPPRQKSEKSSPPPGSK